LVGSGKTTIRLLLDLIHPMAGRGDIFGLGCRHGFVEADRRLTSATGTASSRPAPDDHDATA
jgi:ABC-type multidrug transport system ATPase subunit